MTRLFVLLPLCELEKPTNNSQVIRSVLAKSYPWISAEQILWMEGPAEQGNQQATEFQCAIRTPQVDIGLEQIVETLQAHRMQEELIARLKKDLCELVKSYNAIKSSTWEPQHKNKEECNEEEADISLNFKMERELRSSERKEERQYSEEELLKSISNLTRQNIKLKGMLSYYEAQVEFMSKEGQCPLPENEK